MKFLSNLLLEDFCGKDVKTTVRSGAAILEPVPKQGQGTPCWSSWLVSHPSRQTFCLEGVVSSAKGQAQRTLAWPFSSRKERQF